MFLSVVPFGLYGQSLGKERINKIRSSVVHIFVDGLSKGTGFIVLDKHGKMLVLTCWHTIENSNANESNPVGNNEQITARFNDGEEVKIAILPDILGSDRSSAITYDYCFLEFLSLPKQKISPFKIGAFSDIEEGDRIYMCGFPLNIDQHFISTGILSTKYIGKTDKNNQDVNCALMDISLSVGNSGGPIIKFCRNAKKDIVIGIATYVVSHGRKEMPKYHIWLDQARQEAKHDNNPMLNGILATLEGIVTATQYTTNGIGGCYSIDYAMNYLKSAK